MISPPRAFATGNHGYHNATLGTTGVAIQLPIGGSGVVVQVSAGCFIGLRSSATLATFDDAHYASVLNGMPLTFDRLVGGGGSYLHIAPWTGTAVVAVAFI